MSIIHTIVRNTKKFNSPLTFHLYNPNLPHIMKYFGKYAIKNNYFIVHNLSDKYRYLIPELEKINAKKNNTLWTIQSYEHIIMK